MSAAIDPDMRRGYTAQRGVSQGASITLLSVSGGYRARFECAARAAAIIGTRHQNDYGELLIPMDEVFRALGKLSETCSVALLDTVTDQHGTRFALVWLIAASKPLPANQGPEDLDDY